mmetsp:Transcript_73048/g.152526  ORF Transcript_73048/g.152526 Transcript_73048/m.152526 type:complete len:251 (+) Transcript_73048:111-863(+)|eukprot:CAMPEP_0206463032 /NCGR_PEP_ID=MMETSP0324_2-20121206/26345_1 /ASSEMBLY_ACC=CAM_ASM_000836 /TAXON_ID=2866 /ORGANISM="Crypthecodinium cohnii, Strain Seligo" /LENGTH=250 /DNA_ID=CAMNT_0053935327 /DNA_START=88 /DNA_END=840 /DNA_ORIENTATION=+
MGNCTGNITCECDNLQEMQHVCLGAKDSKHFETELNDSQAMLNHLLLRASDEGSLEAVKACIDRGAYLETRRPFAMSPDGDFNPQAIDLGLTPLMYAAQSGYFAACEELLLAKADVNAEDEDGLTPLHFAAMAASQEVCVLLLQFGANSEALDIEDRTPLELVPPLDRVTKQQQEAWRTVFSTEAVPSLMHRGKTRGGYGIVDAQAEVEEIDLEPAKEHQDPGRWTRMPSRPERRWEQGQPREPLEHEPM